MSARCISADSHVLEPPDLWVTRLESGLRDRAPHVEPGETGNMFVMEGRAPTQIRGLGTPFATEATQVEEGRRGGWDPGVRVEEMAMDGLEAEVLYPSMGLHIHALEDPKLQAACFSVYNDWVGEFCSAYPSKLKGIAQLGMRDLDAGVAELRRAARMGHVGAMIWGDPPDGYGLDTDYYDPLWAEAQSLGMPISLHVHTGDLGKKWDRGGFMSTYVLSTYPIQQSLVRLIFSGVFQRFPELKIISVENDIGWVPYLRQRMDDIFKRKGHRFTHEFKSDLLPSEYLDRNVMYTFMVDRVGLKNLDEIGAESLMWSTDYPHSDSTWPHSQELADEQFAGVSAGDRDRIMYSNVAELYKLKAS